MRRHLVKADSANFFFQPLNFYLETANLLIEICLDFGLGLLPFRCLFAEHFGTFFLQLLFPLFDLCRALGAPDFVLTGNLVDRLQTFECFQPDLELEFGTKLSSFCHGCPPHDWFSVS